MAEDYYGILGVERDASRAEIQDAYRELARRYHPDTNPDDPEAAKRFVQIDRIVSVRQWPTVSSCRPWWPWPP